MRLSSVFLGIVVAAAGGCNKPDPFKPVPECAGPTVVPFGGDRQMVVASLGIADPGQGFDLNLDGKIDNVLGPLASLANSNINTSFTKGHDIVLPLELFGYTGQSSSTCTKMSFYLGAVNKDRDGDGKNTNWSNGDCMDIDATIHPGATEIIGNRVDDDCDGYADNATPMSKPSGAAADMDLDGDGYSESMGDCDDRNDTPEHLALAKTRHPGAKDLCDDGIDQNCDGIPDNDPSCDPFMDNDVHVDVQTSSFVDPTAAVLQPNIAFKEGTIKAGVLNAGPDLFSINVPFRGGAPLALQLTGARVQMTLTDDGSKTHAASGLLGGVLNAISLSQITGINAGGVIKADQSLLDAVFVGPVATILGLDQDKDNHYLPDIDVDGDGLETFYNTNGPAPSGSVNVDTCKDGDGTIIMSAPGAPCPLAKDAKGNYRFVDGLSAALRFNAVPAQLNTTLVP